MKTYYFSNSTNDDRLRMIIVKKNNTVIIKQKNPEKQIELPPSRWAAFRQMIEEIDSNVRKLDDDASNVKYQAHIGGGIYVSVTSGFKCVDFRKFYLPFNMTEPKPTRQGVALRLWEWAEIRRLVEVINNDRPTLSTTLPCYMDSDHQNQMGAFSCLECYPFLNLQ